MKAKRQPLQITVPAHGTPASVDASNGMATGDATEDGSGLSLKPPRLRPHATKDPVDDSPRPSPFHMPG